MCKICRLLLYNHSTSGQLLCLRSGDSPEAFLNLWSIAQIQIDFQPGPNSHQNLVSAAVSVLFSCTRSL